MQTTDTCRTPIRMMEYQSDLDPTANTADAPPDSNISQADNDISIISDTNYSSKITSLLDSVFNIIGNHPEAKDAVASALMALNQA